MIACYGNYSMICDWSALAFLAVSSWQQLSSVCAFFTNLIRTSIDYFLENVVWVTALLSVVTTPNFNIHRKYIKSGENWVKQQELAQVYVELWTFM